MNKRKNKLRIVLFMEINTPFGIREIQDNVNRLMANLRQSKLVEKVNVLWIDADMNYDGEP